MCPCRRRTFVFAFISEPCQSVSSSSALGNLGLGGKLKYHCTTKATTTSISVAWAAGDAASLSSTCESNILAAMLAGSNADQLITNKNCLWFQKIRDQGNSEGDVTHFIRTLTNSYLLTLVGKVCAAGPWKRILQPTGSQRSRHPCGRYSYTIPSH